jgi:hypothetical protein
MGIDLNPKCFGGNVCRKLRPVSQIDGIANGRVMIALAVILADHPTSPFKSESQSVGSGPVLSEYCLVRLIGLTT